MPKHPAPHSADAQDPPASVPAESVAGSDTLDALEGNAGTLRDVTISEWREGRDKVVEIQRPGEDVEVQVFKNAYPRRSPPSSGSSSSASPTSAAGSLHALRASAAKSPERLVAGLRDEEEKLKLHLQHALQQCHLRRASPAPKPAAASDAARH